MSDKTAGRRKRRRLYEQEAEPEPTPAVALEPAPEPIPIGRIEPVEQPADRGVIEGFVVVSSRANSSADSPEAAVRELATIYEVRYDEQQVRRIITDMIGSSAITMGRIGLVPLHFVPVFGKIVRQAIEPVMENAVTYAASKVFKTHFDRGGTIEDLPAKTMRDRFRKGLAEGRKILLPRTAS